MAERYANCTVHHSMHSDRRFDLLAQLAGWSRPEACWRMVELWARCTALKTDRPPAEEIRIHLGLRGEQLLVDAVLGERTQDGSVRVLGGGLTGGDTDRFGWYEPIEARNSAGGRARADQVRREGRAAGGKFAPAGTSVTSAGTSVTSDPPASTSNPPASGFRIPDPDQKELSPSARAILPTAVPAEDPPIVPAMSRPSPCREDNARTQPAPTYDHTDPRAIGRLAEATWRRISDAAIGLAAELKLPAPLPFPQITPSSNRRGFVELKDRIREEGALAPAVCDRVVENLVKQARLKRSVEWLAEKALGDKAWINARNGVDPSARASGAKSAPASPPPITSPPVIEVSDADRAESAAIAREALARLFPSFPPFPEEET